MVAVAVLAGIAVVSYRSVIGFQQQAKSVERAQQVVRETEGVLSDLKDAETGVRGFIIMGDPAYLEPYHQALSSLPARLLRLSGLTADGAAEARVRDLAQLATQRLEAAEISLEKASGARRAAVDPELRLHLAAGKSAMDGVRRLVEQIRLDEERRLALEAAEAERVAQWNITSIIVGNAVSLSILVIAFVVLRREVDSRAQAQRTAQDLNAQIQDLYDRAPCGYHSVDRDGVFVFMNQTELRWLGYRPEEVIGKLKFIEVVAPEYRGIVRENFPKLLRGEMTDSLEYQLLRKDGSRFPVSVSATPVMDADGNFVMTRTTMFDISALAAARATLQEAHAFLDAVVENIPSMVFVKHADTLRFARINRAEEETLGIPREHLLGKSDHDLFPAEQADFFVAKDREVLASDAMTEIKEELLTTATGTRILQTRKVALRDANGVPRYLLGISVDITDRKLAEDRIAALNADLEIRANQLEAANKELESFSYSVSHDLRSPLRAIDGFSRLLEEDYREVLDEEGRRLLSVVRQNSQKMGQLIDDLLAFSRMGRKPIAPEPVDMAALVGEAIADVRTAMPEPAVSIVVGTLASASGDPALLKQVWINLISNGAKYSSSRERPEVEIGSTSSDDGTVYFVRDNGVGFDMQYYDKLFGVFQRLHRAEEFPGTGVGLAIVHRVVSRHGGRVWATSEMDKGATFFFSLPERG